MNQLEQHMRHMPSSAKLRFIEDTLKALRKSLAHPIVGNDKREAQYQADVALKQFPDLYTALQNREAVKARMEEA